MQLKTIHLHGFVDQMIQIQMSDTPRIISDKIQLPQPQHFMFIHYGRLLSPALSFKVQGVKDNDDLYIILKKGSQQSLESSNHSKSKYLPVAKADLKKQIMERYQDRFNDEDQLFEQMLFARNPKTHNEFARLVDLYKMRSESNPNSFRKIVNTFESYQATKELNKTQEKSEQTIIPPKPPYPSTDLMPIFPT